MFLTFFDTLAAGAKGLEMNQTPFTPPMNALCDFMLFITLAMVVKS